MITYYESLMGFFLLRLGAPQAILLIMATPMGSPIVVVKLVVNKLVISANRVHQQMRGNGKIGLSSSTVIGNVKEMWQISLFSVTTEFLFGQFCGHFD
jgi:hypothetical protein